MNDPIVRKVANIGVARFYENYRESLQLQLVNSPLGMSRLITQPAINRPGLALAGYMEYFAFERIQVFGNSESAFLNSLEGEERRRRLEQLTEFEKTPCLIFSRALPIPADLITLANERNLCIFSTPQFTMKFANNATKYLEADFAPSTSLHGCMVSVRGVGVLLTGKGGIGKSEISLGLIERGASLVADDMVRVCCIGNELIAKAPELSSGFLEIRGLGIINVTNLFGLRAYSRESKVDLVINLTDTDMSEMERLGLDRKITKILGVEVECLKLPVAPGRDMSRLVEVAALGHYLRASGFDMAGEFNKRLHQEISRRSVKKSFTQNN